MKGGGGGGGERMSLVVEQYVVPEELLPFSVELFEGTTREAESAATLHRDLIIGSSLFGVCGALVGVMSALRSIRSNDACSDNDRLIRLGVGAAVGFVSGGLVGGACAWAFANGTRVVGLALVTVMKWTETNYVHSVEATRLLLLTTIVTGGWIGLMLTIRAVVWSKGFAFVDMRGVGNIFAGEKAIDDGSEGMINLKKSVSLAS
uniref:Uncharacterized protein n=2 Tax=Hemiselmis andersenii TaxID=464988 RepID=A0A7S1EI19_HEMAN